MKKQGGGGGPGITAEGENDEMQLLGLWAWVLCSSALPFVFTAWLWKRRAKSKLDWALNTSVVAAFASLAFIAAPWAMTNYYLRFVLVAFLALAVCFSFRKGREAPLYAPSSAGTMLAHTARAIGLLLLLLLDAIVVKDYYFVTARPAELAFPLSGGDYYVVPNPLHRDGPYPTREWYALDLVKLNRVGSRAAGVYPRALSSYAIYGETVSSPCGGEVVRVFDGVPDNPIGDAGRHPSNHVVIRCGALTVTLAHLMSGSLLVRDGQGVTAGQPLGKVSNSGHTSEPHLHIDAVRDVAGPAAAGEPVQISFDRRVPSWNSVIRR